MPVLDKEQDLEYTEIHCHSCDKYIRVSMQRGLDGNHIVNCPNCGHEHCRVVKDGKITDIRWDQRNGNTYTMTVINCSSTSIGWTGTMTFSGTNSATFVTVQDAVSTVFIQDLWIGTINNQSGGT